MRFALALLLALFVGQALAYPAVAALDVCADACSTRRHFPMVVLRLHGTELERPLAVVMIGGLVSSTLFTLLALPAFLALAHELGERTSKRRA